jgi:hypothetical protein
MKLGKSDYAVETKNGKKGLVYHDEPNINGKVKVFIIGDDYKLTGEKILCDIDNLKMIGFFD